ncbi:hypothetical protein MP638_003149 [Amoeboaphelidium occidentale]|nr:hypothetical protein MP638_003149 [Amoeboaphelidium occidentale]
MNNDKDATYLKLLDAFAALGTGLVPGYKGDTALVRKKPEVPVPVQLLMRLRENGSQKVPLDLYRTKLEDFWFGKSYSVRTTENPLLFEVPTSAKSQLEYYKEINPSIKLRSWPHRNPEWTEKFWNAAYQLKQALLSGKIGNSPVTIRRVLESIGQWRQWVLMEKDLVRKTEDGFSSPVEYDDYHQFGVFQDDHALRDSSMHKSFMHMVTEISGFYKKLIVDGKSVGDIYSLPKEEMMKIIHRPPGALSPIQESLAFSVNQSWPNYQGIFVRIGEQSVELVEYQSNHFGVESWSVQNTFYLPSIENKMDSILKGIVEASQNPDVPLSEFHKMVATLHWFIATTSPHIRGSAAAADLLTATSYMLRGLRWPGWAENISADVTALSTANLQTFQNIFASLMDDEVHKVPI